MSSREGDEASRVEDFIVDAPLLLLLITLLYHVWPLGYYLRTRRATEATAEGGSLPEEEGGR